MEIRNAEKKDIGAIRSLWKLCFSDHDDYLNLYFKYRFAEKNTKLLILDGAVIGMIHLLPCSIDKKKALYWYAVGISPKMRNLGYFKKFSDEVLKENRNRGYFNLCQPLPGLEDIYIKRGFQYEYRARDIDFYGSDTWDISPIIEKATEDDFLLEKEKKSGSVYWKKYDIKYAIMENDFCDGTSLKFYFSGKEYVALAINKDDHFLLDSTNITPEVAKKTQNEILQFLGTKHFKLRTSELTSADRGTIVGLSDNPSVGEGSTISFVLA